MTRLAFAALAAAAVAILPAAEALAQAWPNKTIKFVVPQPAGGSNDAMGRAVGEQLSKQLGQPIVVDNRPGASGAVGMEVVASSPADGYTFVVASDTVALQPVLRQGLKWNVERDFVPVTMFGAQPIVVAVPANSSYKTMKEVIAAAKASPGKIGYATSGQGSLQPLAGELGRHLQQQGRLADAGIAADQHGGARHQAAAGDTVELGDAADQARRWLAGAGEADHRQRLRPAAAATLAQAAGSGGRARYLLDDGVPLAAALAAPAPLRECGATALADEAGRLLGQEARSQRGGRGRRRLRQPSESSRSGLVSASGSARRRGR